MSWQNLATLYGNYLTTKNRHDEAGVMFVKGEVWELALEAFKLASNWRQVFCVAARLGYDGNKLSALAMKVAGALFLFFFFLTCDVTESKVMASCMKNCRKCMI